jgi:ribosomal protein S18 acetylase RimI-like enzyme
VTTGGVFSIEPRGFSSADAQALIDAVQAEYVVRYGGPDATAVDPTEFDPPDGVFLVGYLRDADGRDVAVACGGWRRADPGVAEIKRMYVAPSVRRRGLAWRMLAELESRARAAGITQVRLETGSNQPEAVAMYGRAGYSPVAPFGLYAHAPSALHLGKGLA